MRLQASRSTSSQRRYGYHRCRSATGITEGTDTFTGVNAVQGSMFGDTLLGSSFNNTFTGLGGDDFIDGRGGFDTASYNSLSTATGGINVGLAAGFDGVEIHGANHYAVQGFKHSSANGRIPVEPSRLDPSPLIADRT